MQVRVAYVRRQHAVRPVVAVRGCNRVVVLVDVRVKEANVRLDDIRDTLLHRRYVPEVPQRPSWFGGSSSVTLAPLGTRVNATYS